MRFTNFGATVSATAGFVLTVAANLTRSEVGIGGEIFFPLFTLAAYAIACIIAEAKRY